MSAMSELPRKGIDRRGLLLSAGTMAALPLIGGEAFGRERSTKASWQSHRTSLGTRMLGKLQVSNIGIGVQNNFRKYTTETPYRPEQIALLRAAFDSGVRFFDCAEAYGPHECERILGEAIQPFRNKVVITSKFGWNIDQETGQRKPGLNSRPEHIKAVVDNMLRRLRTDRIDLLYQHRVRRKRSDQSVQRDGGLCPARREVAACLDGLYAPPGRVT